MIIAGAVSLRHTMHYRYDAPVQLGPQVVRLSPTPYYRARILQYSLSVTPEDHALNWLQDPNGNWLARYVFPARTTELRIDVRLDVDLRPLNPFDFVVDGTAADWPFAYTAETRSELGAYLARDAADPAIEAFAGPWAGTSVSTVQLLVEVNARINQVLGYEVRSEAGVYSPAETLARMTGSCRDIAWLGVQVFRQLGFGARFVSGYLLNLAVPDDTDDGDGEFSGLHAWVEVYLPGVGWVGMDPTSGTFCNEAYVPLAACAHYDAAAPLTGSVEPSRVEFHHELHVERLARATSAE